MASVRDALRRARAHGVADAVAATAEEALSRRAVSAIGAGAAVGLDAAEEVLLVCSRRGRPDFHAETFSQEIAFEAELAARGRRFAVTDDAAALTGKSVAWFHPTDLVLPKLWDYSRQVREFAAGIEDQGNRVFSSSHEAAFWENKAHMHREMDRVGAAAPRTLIVTATDLDALEIEFEPVIVKQEHAAGSAGIHFLPTAEAAVAFVNGYAFRPGESLIVQAVVSGATRDLRLTMVGDRVIDSATYWRVKSEAALAAKEWTTTATTYGSTVVHEAPPPAAVAEAARVLRELSLRTAGIDLMWENDDVTGPPLMLEFSPFFQPNPPKPPRYAARSYKSFKDRRFAPDGYYYNRHLAHREIAAAILDQGLY